MLFQNQRGVYESFNVFMERFIGKFDDKGLKRKSDVKDFVWRQPMPESLRNDIPEPNAINVMYDWDSTTMNILSQDFTNLATYDEEDKLHCVVSGLGEKIHMVHPYQRFGIKAGQSQTIKNPKGQKETIEISKLYSLMELGKAKVNIHDQKYIKIITLDLQPGDCAYIPMFWWF